MGIPAKAQDTGGNAPLAVVGSSEITEQELDRILSGRPMAFSDLPPDTRRERMLEMLVAEYLIDYFYGQDPDRLSDAVLASLSDARRQVLFQLYAQSRFIPPEITEADIEAFVSAHPERFTERLSYRFLQVDVFGGSPQERRQAGQRIERSILGADIPLAAVNELLGTLEREGFQPTLATVWTTSEALPDDLQTRLSTMRADDRRIDQEVAGDHVSVLFLQEAIPVPVAPEDVRDQIEARILQQAFAEHREALTERLAASVLGGTLVGEADASTTLEIEPPAPGTVVWTSQTASGPLRSVSVTAFMVSWCLAVLGVFATVSWTRWVGRAFPHVQATSFYVPTLMRPGAARFVGGALLLAILLALVASIWVGDALLGTRLVVVLAGGALVLGAGIAWVMADASRRRFEAQRRRFAEEAVDDGWAERSAILDVRTNRRLAMICLCLMAQVLLALIAAGDMIWMM